MDAKFYTSQLLRVRDGIPEAERRYFDERFRQRSIDPVRFFVISAWFGLFGIDRFMLGQNLLGAFKLLTLGGIGVWYVADLFRIGGVVRSRNMAMANEMRDSLSGRWI